MDIFISITDKTGLLLTYCVITSIISVCYGGELFTSTDKIRDLSLSEDKVIPEFENVVQSLEHRIHTLKGLLQDIKSTTHNGPVHDNVINHPVRIYHLMKRWMYINDMFYNEPSSNDTILPPFSEDVDNTDGVYGYGEEEGEGEYEEDGDEDYEDDTDIENIVTGISYNCRDKLEACPEMIKDDSCKKYQLYMSAKCTLSCNVCQRPKVRDEADFKIQELFNKVSIAKLPDFDDYDGGSEAMVRLQRTYGLDTQDIIDGRIHGYTSLSNLSAYDVFYIGYVARFMDEWGFAAQWLNKAKQLNTDSQIMFNISVQLAFVYLQMKDYHKANESLTTALREHPLELNQLSCYDKEDICTSLANGEQCNEKEVADKCPFSCEVCTTPESFMGEYELSDLLYRFHNKTKSLKSQKSSVKEPNTLRSNSSVYKWKSEYEALCRGEQTRHYVDAFCHYRPAVLAWNVYKEEVLSLNPRISQVYDVISDYEADYIKNVVKSRMRRGVVGTTSTTSNSRVSDVGWLYDEDDALVQKISERVEMITGLEITSQDPYNEEINRTSSEPFQAVNYGIGGQYEPHVDYFTGDKDLNGSFIDEAMKASGDRMVTFLLYLTDVKAGGATVYPKVKVHVPPVKNAAAFWYNARLSGKYDPLTLHAGCPVLLGEKWVCNKWVREHRNDFKRRCGLTRNAKYKKCNIV